MDGQWRLWLQILRFFVLDWVLFSKCIHLPNQNSHCLYTVECHLWNPLPHSIFQAPDNTPTLGQAPFFQPMPPSHHSVFSLIHTDRNSHLIQDPGYGRVTGAQQVPFRPENTKAINNLCDQKPRTFLRGEEAELFFPPSKNRCWQE